jgi:hypothetical protein
MNKFVKALKHTFIPHKHNDYKPHILREVSIASMALIAVFLLFISASTIFYIKNTNMTATVLPAVLVDLTNNARVSSNTQTLTRNTVLDNAARMKAEDMVAQGYFAHTSPKGVTPWHWFDKAGYYFSYAGENLAINFTESADVENAWLASPTHKANILNNNFTEIGIATMDGIYQGRPTTYVVQMFGKPAFKPVEAPKKTTPVKKEKTTLVKKTTTPATIALAPSVKGESVEVVNNLETITDTNEFASVKNNDVSDNVTKVKETPVKYSSWTNRFMFMTPSYVDMIYKILMWIVLISLVVMMVVEIRLQHPKNIMYGILLLLIIFSLIYINKNMFITSLLA